MLFRSHCGACQGESEEERREEDTGFQIPVVVSPVSLGTEKGSNSSVEHSHVSQ